MEKIFRPSKWFVLFCLILIIVWGTLQIVSNMVLEERAKEITKEIFTWQWPDKTWSSQVKDMNTSVLSRSRTDAIVKVNGKQDLIQAADNVSKSQICDFTLVLSFYQVSNHWVLGKVELL
jgi:cell division protein FtsL